MKLKIQIAVDRLPSAVNPLFDVEVLVRDDKLKNRGAQNFRLWQRLNHRRWKPMGG